MLRPKKTSVVWQKLLSNSCPLVDVYFDSGFNHYNPDDAPLDIPKVLGLVSNVNFKNSKITIYYLGLDNLWVNVSLAAHIQLNPNWRYQIHVPSGYSGTEVINRIRDFYK